MEGEGYNEVRAVMGRTNSIIPYLRKDYGQYRVKELESKCNGKYTDLLSKGNNHTKRSLVGTP